MVRNSSVHYRRKAEAIRERAEIEPDDEKWEDLINALHRVMLLERLAERREAKAKAQTSVMLAELFGDRNVE